jgi:hypothetical protein
VSAITPWWEAIQLREEIRSASGSIDDVQMSLYNAVYGSAGAKADYAKASYFGDITHPSANLVDLMAHIAVRLAGPGDTYQRAQALRRLDQGMGGGKSHGLIGLWHLAAHPRELATTDIGKAVFRLAGEICASELPDDLGTPKVVVLACDNMTAGKGDRAHDGPAESLYERFLWRLFEGNNTRFLEYAPHFADKAKIAEALAYDGRPVLILVDEILDYVRQLSDSQHADLRTRDMAFLKAITDVVNDVPHVAMVVVMIDSEKDSMSLDAIAQDNRAEIEASLQRNGTPATVTSNTDFVAILRRRLFDRVAPAEVVRATASQFLDVMRGVWTEKVFDTAALKMSAADFEAEVERCYPFHPSLIRMVEEEWAPLAGFQKVRSTIRIFAATAWALADRGREGAWSPALIGAGDLVLSNSTVREAIIGSGLISDPKTQANYRGIASADIVSDDGQRGSARLLDIAREADESVLFRTVNPRAAERAATALFLYSVIGTRAQGRRGATEAELKAATFVPSAGYGMADADEVIAGLLDPDTGLAALERIAGVGGQPARMFLSTKQTLTMWFRSMRNSVSDDDRDEAMAIAIERLMSTGPFKDKKFVGCSLTDERPLRDLLAEAQLDDARSTRLIVLDPREFSFGNGSDTDTRAAVRAALGIGENKILVAWGASAVFAVINTQRRKAARAAVSEYVAWGRVCDIDAVTSDEGLEDQAKAERAGAKRRVDDLIRKAFQHAVYLGTADSGEGRDVHEIRFDQDNQTTLDGSLVWAQLVEEGRAVGVGQFGARALAVNLDDADYAKPLDELRDLFWQSPRKPLLPNGEQDLRYAAFEAIRAGELRLVESDGSEVVVTRAEDIALGSSRLRLAKPLPPGSGEGDDGDSRPGATGGAAGSGTTTTQPGQPAGVTGDQAKDVLVSFTVNASLTDSARRDAVWKLLQGLATSVDDEQVLHVQVTAKVTAPEPTGQSVKRLAEGAGGSPSIQEL